MSRDIADTCRSYRGLNLSLRLEVASRIELQLGMHVMTIRAKCDQVVVGMLSALLHGTMYMDVYVRVTARMNRTSVPGLEWHPATELSWN